ncbi:MAG TPA: hypothetical protein VNL71_19105 [Chloroflexota bacterium]|nr:hypothetical protein [Chloroflexota bacterium]
MTVVGDGREGVEPSAPVLDAVVSLLPLYPYPQASPEPIHPVARAMLNLVPRNSEFAAAPIDEGFNWAECMADIAHGEWYLVVFRSVRQLAADLDLLTELDDHAFAEAKAFSGLLHYFKGELNGRRECLSFCLWEDQERAQLAALLPKHLDAARMVREMYVSYSLERYRVVKNIGDSAPTFHRLLGGSLPGIAPLWSPSVR